MMIHRGDPRSFLELSSQFQKPACPDPFRLPLHAIPVHFSSVQSVYRIKRGTACTMASEGRPRRRERPQPLPGYVSVYNAHVNDFFLPRNSGLLALTVSLAGAVYGRSEGSAYSRWSAAEKELFFRLLARNSIHRLDLIREGLKTKGEVEILAYYHLLRRGLRRARQSLKMTVYQVLVPRRKTRQSHRCSTHVPGLILYRDMPIAYEMSDAMTQIEEQQALLLIQINSKRARDENRRFQLVLDRLETTDTDADPSANGDADAGADAPNDAPRRAQTGPQWLINYNGLLALAGHFAKTNASSTVPRPHYKSYALLEELVRLYAYKVVVQVAEAKIQNRWILTRNTEKPSLVSRTDVARALECERVASLAFNPPAASDSSSGTTESILHVEQLSQKQTTIPDDSPLVDQLDFLADELLEEEDWWNSRGHEHVLLTFYSTFQRLPRSDHELETPEERELAASAQALASAILAEELAKIADTADDSGGLEDISDDDVIDDDYYEFPTQLIIDHSEMFPTNNQ